MAFILLTVLMMNGKNYCESEKLSNLQFREPGQESNPDLIYSLWAKYRKP